MMDETQALLTAKISKLRNPMQQLKINYAGNKGKHYTEDEDRFLVPLIT
jgi:SLIDE